MWGDRRTDGALPSPSNMSEPPPPPQPPLQLNFTVKLWWVIQVQYWGLKAADQWWYTAFLWRQRPCVYVCVCKSFLHFLTPFPGQPRSLSSGSTVKWGGFQWFWLEMRRVCLVSPVCRKSGRHDRHADQEQAGQVSGGRRLHGAQR